MQLRDNPPMKKPLLWTLVIVLVIGLSGFAYRLLKKNETVIHPKRGPITEAVYGLGKVESNHHYDVITGVLSTVEELFVLEGDQVKKGDPLVRMLNSVVLKTPIDGTVTLVKFKEGEAVLPRDPIVRVEDLTDCYIELSLEQEAALRVRSGMKARVSFESIRHKVIEGKVKAIFPRQDEFLARIEVGKLEPGVLPGMTADVVIEIGNSRKALLIPAKAVTNGLITLRKKGKWVKEKIEIGYVDGTHVEVVSPELSEEDELKVRGP